VASVNRALNFKTMETIYQKAVRLMQPEEIGSHESDLHLKVTEVSQRLVDDYKFKTIVERFISQIDGTAWFDIPFAFDPFRETKTKEYEYQCAECGCNSVEMKMWVNPNDTNRTEPFQNMPTDAEECWCRNCDDHRELIYNPKK
jgi:hypothetical protein